MVYIFRLVCLLWYCARLLYLVVALRGLVLGFGLYDWCFGWLWFRWLVYMISWCICVGVFGCLVCYLVLLFVVCFGGLSAGG